MKSFAAAALYIISKSLRRRSSWRQKASVQLVGSKFTCTICFSIVYSTRLFELVAEEIAIEDTIYYLGKALSQDKVELNAYMKV